VFVGLPRRAVPGVDETHTQICTQGYCMASVRVWAWRSVNVKESKPQTPHRRRKEPGPIRVVDGPFEPDRAETSIQQMS